MIPSCRALSISLKRNLRHLSTTARAFGKIKRRKEKKREEKKISPGNLPIFRRNSSANNDRDFQAPINKSGEMESNKEITARSSQNPRTKSAFYSRRESLRSLRIVVASWAEGLGLAPCVDWRRDSLPV
jgi:hypothetical protein